MTMILVGDCRDVMATLDAASVDAVVTDPPYDLTANKKGGSGAASVNLDSPYGRARIGTGNGGGFMGKDWDATGVAFDPATWEAVARVMKPGAHLLAFGGTRTFHRMTVAIEDAGFEIKDCLSWLHGQGFPKHKSLLKPAWEPIILARKRGAGLLNIDACRIQFVSDDDRREAEAKNQHTQFANPGSNRDSYSGDFPPRTDYDGSKGRWPANVCLDETAAELLDEQSGERKSGAAVRGDEPSRPGFCGGFGRSPFSGHDDTGGASRFFYCAKASRSERNAGLEGMPEHEARPLGLSNWAGQTNGSGETMGPSAPQANNHPTVKPIALMRWLVRLVTPPDGLVLDPFTGSGSTGVACAHEGFRFLGIEQSDEYAEIARRRIAAVNPLFAMAAD